MGLEEMERKIRDLGEREIKGIKREAENEVRRIRKEFGKEAEKRYNDVIREAKKEAKFVKRRVISDSKLKARELVENKKNELIEEVFELARKRILGLNRREMRKVLEKLAEDGKKQVEKPEILIDRKYARLLRKAKISNINDFGVIIKGKKGGVKIDNTLTNKLNQLNNLLRHDVAEVLFGHDKGLRNR